MFTRVNRERGVALIEAALLVVAIALVAFFALTAVGRSTGGLWEQVAAASAADAGPDVRVLGEIVSVDPEQMLKPPCRGSCSVLATRGAWHDIIDGPWDARWRPGNPGF